MYRALLLLLLLIYKNAWAATCDDVVIKGKAPIKGALILHQYQPSAHQSPLPVIARFLAKRHWSSTVLLPHATADCKQDEAAKKNVMLIYGEMDQAKVADLDKLVAKFDGLILVSVQSQEALQDYLKPWLKDKSVLDIFAEFDYQPTKIAATERKKQLENNKNYRQATIMGANHDYQYTKVVLAKQIQSWLVSLKTREIDE